MSFPSHWIPVSFDAVFEQISTTGKKVKTADLLAEGEFPVIDQGRNFISGYLNDASLLITDEAPLIIFGDHTLEIKWIDFPFIPGADGVKILKPSSGMDGRFLYYFLCNLPIQSKGYARHFKILKDSQYLVPPVAEQTRIAQKLDELLAQVDTLKARIDAIPALLKRFRQSVLAAAVSGRLTEEWRASLETYTHPDGDDWKWPPIPQSWQVKRYPEIVESRLGKMLDKAKNTGNLTKYLGNINVRWFDFNLTDVQEIRVSDTEREELTIKKGDVLICEGGEPGRCAIWDDRVDDQIIFQKAIHRARVTEVLMPEWLAFNLKHDAESMVLEQLFTGTTIKHLTGKALNKYPLRIPPLTEQAEIVRRVEQLFAFADQLEAKVATAQARIDRLTQSILAKAFRGELVPQDPNDEPASVLLERIQAQRAAAPRARRGRKATA